MNGMGIASKRDKSKITAFNGEKELHADASTSAWTIYSPAIYSRCETRSRFTSPFLFFVYLFSFSPSNKKKYRPLWCLSPRPPVRVSRLFAPILRSWSWIIYKFSWSGAWRQRSNDEQWILHLADLLPRFLVTKRKKTLRVVIHGKWTVERCGGRGTVGFYLHFRDIR